MKIAEVSEQYELSYVALVQQGDKTIEARKEILKDQRELLVARMKEMQKTLVTFEPGARTAWHSHPLGQTLIVTAGCGLAQGWGGPIQTIRPGDVVWFAAGEKHWHGATATTAMTHISIVEQADGKSVDWVEHVSDEQYHG